MNGLFFFRNAYESKLALALKKLLFNRLAGLKGVTSRIGARLFGTKARSPVRLSSEIGIDSTGFSFEASAFTVLGKFYADYVLRASRARLSA